MQAKCADATAPWMLATALLLAAAGGCGGGTPVGEAPPVVPTLNPDPRDPALGVTEANEAQNLDKIRPHPGKATPR